MEGKAPLRVLFAGLGSIGSRHLKNLAQLAKERGLALEVCALRSSGRALPAELAPLVGQSLAALPATGGWDVAFITNPTHLHADTLKALKGRVGTFFIEKPIFEAAGHSLEQLGLGGGQKAYVAAPMRWTALYLALKEKLPPAVYSARVICSSYLPDWRKGADYRSVYSAKRAMGGGVALDLIHEWDYLCHLFGLPHQVRLMAGRFSHLEIDSDDLAVYIARWPDKLCEVHLDYFGREYRRQAEFYTKEGCVLADFGTGALHLPGGAVADYSEPANQRYLREMAWFLDYALGSGSPSENSPQHALDVLKVALGEETKPI